MERRRPYRRRIPSPPFSPVLFFKDDLPVPPLLWKEIASSLAAKTATTPAREAPKAFCDGEAGSKGWPPCVTDDSEKSSSLFSRAPELDSSRLLRARRSPPPRVRLGRKRFRGFSADLYMMIRERIFARRRRRFFVLCGKPRPTERVASRVLPFFSLSDNDQKLGEMRFRTVSDLSSRQRVSVS